MKGRCIIKLVDDHTGEERVLADGPIMTPGESIRASLARARTKRDLGLVFAFDVGLDPTPESIAALWRIMERNGGRGSWSPLDRTDALRKYLHVAVRREAAAVRRRRRMDGILNDKQRERESRAARELRRIQGPGARPEQVLARRRAVASRRARVARLLARVQLNARERQLVPLVLDGLEPAEAVRRLGFPISVWQNLIRKLRRAADRAA